MILLDTNVVSELMRDRPDPLVVRWADEQPRSSIWTTTVTILEVRFGLDIMPDGHRASELRTAFDRVIDEVFGRRVASFDTEAARATAALMAVRRRRGASQDLRDSMIAGVALSRRATIATRNLAHFADLEIGSVDPWAVPVSSPG